MKKALAIVGLAVATTLSLAACSTGTSTGAGATPSGSKTYTLAYSSPNTGNSFQRTFECSVITAAKKLGFTTVTTSGSSQYNATSQTPVLEAAGALHPDALVTSPTDANALVGPLNAIKANGAKVVVYDYANTYHDIASGAVTADNVKGGATAADALAKSIGDKGTVLVIDDAPGTSTTNDRATGFLSEIKKFPGITTLPIQYDGTDTTKDTSITNAALAAHPDLAAIMPTYNDAAIPIAAALKSAGKYGKVKIVTFDMSDTMIPLLKDGGVSAVVNNAPAEQGKIAAQMAWDAVHGKTVSPDVVKVSMPLVTQANMNEPSIKANFYSATVCKP